MRLRTQCFVLCATNAAALQLIKRPHQQPRVILTTEQVEKLERSVAAALPAVGQWAAFGGVVAGFTGFLWGWAGLPAAGLYASSVASGTAWALAWDHVMPGGGRRVAEMMGGTTVGVPCSVRDAVVPTCAEINHLRDGVATKLLLRRQRLQRPRKCPRLPRTSCRPRNRTRSPRAAGATASSL